MPISKINTRRLNEYKEVFGLQKLRFLWHEYIEQSTHNWQNMETADWKTKRQMFHNWRSSSQVFGMDDFARLCQIIEDKILKRHFDGLEQKIAESRSIYDQSAGDVGLIFLQME